MIYRNRWNNVIRDRFDPHNRYMMLMTYS